MQYYDKPEGNESDIFPDPPTLPRRSISSERRNTVYQYDNQMAPNIQLYEIPQEPDAPSNSTTMGEYITDDLESELSDLVIEPATPQKKIFAWCVVLSAVFGIAGGVVGASVLSSPVQPIFSCPCFSGQVFFSASTLNQSNCYVLANGQVINNRAVPNLLQKNGLFVRAGTENEAGLVEDDAVNFEGLTVSAQANNFPLVFDENGNGETTGFFLTQPAIFGITGSERGKNVIPSINVSVSAPASSETRPVSIRMLPYVCL